MTKEEKKRKQNKKKRDNPLNTRTTTIDACGLLLRDPMLPARQQRGQLNGVWVK